MTSHADVGDNIDRKTERFDRISSPENCDLSSFICSKQLWHSREMRNAEIEEEEENGEISNNEARNYNFGKKQNRRKLKVSVISPLLSKY